MIFLNLKKTKSIPINVYYIDKDVIAPLKITKKINKKEKHVHLLHFKNKDTEHYC